MSGAITGHSSSYVRKELVRLASTQTSKAVGSAVFDSEPNLKLGLRNGSSLDSPHEKLSEDKVRADAAGELPPELRQKQRPLTDKLSAKSLSVHRLTPFHALPYQLAN